MTTLHYTDCSFEKIVGESVSTIQSRSVPGFEFQINPDLFTIDEVEFIDVVVTIKQPKNNEYFGKSKYVMQGSVLNVEEDKIDDQPVEYVIISFGGLLSKFFLKIDIDSENIDIGDHCFLYVATKTL